MNVDFKLIWIEDEDAAFDAHYDDIESIIKAFDLIPKIERYRSSTIDLNMVKDADLILADYDLGTENSVSLIHNSIRNNNIVIDALMYSSKYDRMVNNIRAINPLLEGVFCAKRGTEDLMQKFESLVFRIVKRAQSIENLRGLVMEYSSVFDKKMLLLISKTAEAGYWDQVLSFINKDIAQSKKQSIFKACTKEKANCKNQCTSFEKACTSIKGCCFNTHTVDLSNLDKFELFDKSRIFNCILKCLIANQVISDKVDYRNFHKNFYEEIIVYRNALAHQNSDEKQLYIRQKDAYVAINDVLFSTIKKSIIKYKELLEELDQIQIS